MATHWRSSWLFRMFVCTDANFRLSNRMTRSTDKTDPTFNDGRGYMVRITDFDDFLKSVEGNEDHVEPVSVFKRVRPWSLTKQDPAQRLQPLQRHPTREPQGRQGSEDDGHCRVLLCATRVHLPARLGATIQGRAVSNHCLTTVLLASFCSDVEAVQIHGHGLHCH